MRPTVQPDKLKHFTNTPMFLSNLGNQFNSPVLRLCSHQQLQLIPNLEPSTSIFIPIDVEQLPINVKLFFPVPNGNCKLTAQAT